jgi:GR25 family glycosyltransferase involved in LPS biosynthesis
MLPRLPFHIYWINLERRPDRKKNMELILKNNEGNHTRINAVDYANDFAPYKVIHNGRLKPGEIGCICSHIIALYTFVTSSTDDHAFIAEDDIDIEYCKYWKKYHYDLLQNDEIEILQMLTTSDVYNNKNMKEIETHNSSTAFYRIKRIIANKILNDFFNSRLNSINLTVHFRPVADVVIWEYGKVYLIPMISYLNVKDSETDAGNKNMDEYWTNYFANAKNKYLEYWKNLH